MQFLLLYTLILNRSRIFQDLRALHAVPFIVAVTLLGVPPIWRSIQFQNKTTFIQLWPMLLNISFHHAHHQRVLASARTTHNQWHYTAAKRVNRAQSKTHAAAPVLTAVLPEDQATANDHQLISWVQQQGGWVHPALNIVDDAPCGCRGVIATVDIYLQQQRQQHGESASASNGWGCDSLDQRPLIAVPEELYMTSADAIAILGSAILQHGQSASNANTRNSSSAAQKLLQLPQLLMTHLSPAAKAQKHQQQLAESLSKLQPPLLLALLLAYERTKGPESFWFPYIAALPDVPPCGWFPTLQQQQQQQQVQGPSVADDVIAAAAAAVMAKCTAAANVYGPALGRRITAVDVVWAYGQVVSRAFGSDTGIGLAPLIDMLNHKQGSGSPQKITSPPPAAAAAAADDDDDDDGPAAAAVAADDAIDCWVVMGTAKQGQQLVLAAGEELYISYVARCDAQAAFLNFGFVPPEKQGEKKE